MLSAAARHLGRSVRLVGDADLSAPTPCPGWDLGHLLGHVRSSLDDLTEVLTGEPGPAPGPDPAAAVRASIVGLLVAWAVTPGRRCEVEDRWISPEIVGYTAAAEMVLHAWDISRACGADHPVPAALATRLLEVSPLLAVDRFFAAPLDVPATAAPGERLLALFGRQPR
ncbi:TIGR03086 family metal-binding protein [Amycolatopsis sp. NBC_01480]|uniref:TIGR03086 family metal-binding protein n=1 Tax=Amycolatopsis sp. NBC_01480 TaxID=2903562 RepID=UPI002E28DD55|nr:TIGR03086 family metal-binding protein [Amycolatopsis sp. NBC_01480]